MDRHQEFVVPNPLPVSSVLLGEVPGGVLYVATSLVLYRLAPGDTTWQKILGDQDTNAGTPNAQVLNLVSDVAVRPGTNGKEVVAVRGWRAGVAPPHVTRVVNGCRG
jgi:hypothetical protein